MSCLQRSALTNHYERSLWEPYLHFSVPHSLPVATNHKGEAMATKSHDMSCDYGHYNIPWSQRITSNDHYTAHQWSPH